MKEGIELNLFHKYVPACYAVDAGTLEDGNPMPVVKNTVPWYQLKSDDNE